MPFIPFATAALVKASLQLCDSIQVEGLEHLFNAFAQGKPVLTISNHISVLDDPCAWSVAMPLRYFLDSRTTRWTLGASDIVFKNAPLRLFFNRGQVIETFRSSADPIKAGIYQPAIDLSIKKLDQGQWLHIFPEAKVHQNAQRELLRFRWGVSRILMEVKRKDVVILPVWLEGFDDLMPLERGFPRFIPRFFGTKLKVIIGPSITAKVAPLIDEYHRIAGGAQSTFKPDIGKLTDIKGRRISRPRPPYYEGDSEESKRVRIEIAALLREEVQKLGKVVEHNGGPRQRIGARA